MRYAALSLTTLSGLLALAGAAGAAEPARYQVVFERTWSAETHPQDFQLPLCRPTG